MTLYCVVDCQPIPPERVAKKAVTCSQECADEYRRQRRQERAGVKCRLCGRKFRKSRTHADVPTETQQATVEEVLHEHTGIADAVTTDMEATNV